MLIGRAKRGCLIVALALLPWLAGGCGKGNSQAGQGGGAAQGVKAGVTAADLRAEITGPHLWMTVTAISLKNGKLTAKVHIERGGSGGPVKVSLYAMNNAPSKLVLRTKDGEPIRLRWYSENIIYVDPDWRASVSVPQEGLDMELAPWPEPGAGPQQWKSLAAGPSEVPAGTWLRYYLSTVTLCYSEDMREEYLAPVMGVGLVRFNGDEAAPQGAKEADVVAGGTTSDLRAEVTVPHLWITLESASLKGGRATLGIYLHGSGGLGPVSVSRSDLQRALQELALRTREGIPVGLDTSMDARNSKLAAPPANLQDYVPVQGAGLEFDAVPFGRGIPTLLTKFSTPPDLPAGTLVRYYLCTEVNCLNEDTGEVCYVPLMGIGLVQFGSRGQ